MHIFVTDCSGNITDFYVQDKVPSLRNGETKDVVLQIPLFWIYNPDASFDLIIDFDNNIVEKNEDNNTKSYHEKG